MKKYRMMISDIDGTLVDDCQKISEVNKKAIKEFQERGGVFSLATGRIEEAVKKYHDELSINAPVILYNGAKVVDINSSSVIYEKLLTAEQAKTAASIVDKYPVTPVFYSKGRAFVRDINRTAEIYSAKDGIKLETVDNYSDIDLSAVTKILLIGDNSCFPKFREVYNNFCKDYPVFVQSEEEYLEILPKGVNKGEAVSVLSEYLDIPVEEIICIGDNLNDLEMVEFAGLGVAMENGHEKLKNLADIIAPPNTESGLAAVLEKYTN